MKLSIINFKTIRELRGFDFNSINIITGVNSSGKTSFTQFTLMLKQTLEAQSANPALILNGDWVKLGNFENLVYKKNTNCSISFELQLDKEQIRDKLPAIYGVENVIISADYQLNGVEMILSHIRMTHITPQRQHFAEFNYDNSGSYSFNSDSALWVNEFNKFNQTQGNINTIAFFPSTFNTEIDNPDCPKIDTNPKKTVIVEIKTKEIQNIVNGIFNNISYIGPLRVEPQDIYDGNKKSKYIGSKREYAAQFFEEEANNTVEFYCIYQKELKKMSMREAVKYWICDVFKLAKDIKAQKNRDRYEIRVVNHYDVESTIKQVGFGISQVLPIIVEGLRMNQNSILILEQPEIHLHPKVQSVLFDFIYSLSLTGRKFVIETHSDHFITRARRRVAEDNGNLSEKINLVFVEERESEHLFRKLNLDDMGTFDYFPTDFVEQTEDCGAIIKAQAKKSKNKR